MRKYLLCLFIFLSCSSGVYSQEKVIINFSDGTDSIFYYWDIQSITFEEETESKPASEPDTVNLGLSSGTLWADINYGVDKTANVIDSSGYLIGWGDVTARNTSTDQKWYPLDSYSENIYLTDYDIAHVKWGGSWQLPTKDDFQELIDDSTCTWQASENGVTVKGKNDSFIFLPYTGCRYGEKKEDTVPTCYYWSGTVSEGGDTAAVALKITVSKSGDNYTVDKKELVDKGRCYGLGVRAVWHEDMYNVTMSVEADNVSKTTATVNVAYTGILDDIDERGIIYSTSSSLSGAKKVTSSSTGRSVSFSLTGLSQNTTYYVAAYSVCEDETFYSDTLNFTTKNSFPVAEPVDMGLSVKWASFNLGATAPEEKGTFMGWGDPTGTVSTWNVSDYAKGIGSKTDIQGDTSLDAAAALWGGMWAMPTQAQLQALIDSCDITRTSSYNSSGQSGLIFTSKINNKEIFFPTGGYTNSSGSQSTSYCYYWTSERKTQYSTAAIYLLKNASYDEFKETDYAVKMQVRPVYLEATSVNDGSTAEAGDAVDLGLSVKWADRNVGAEKASDYGDYFTWGDTVTQESFTKSDYKYYDASSGYTDLGKSISGSSEYDVAVLRWGGKWRIPTSSEFIEMKDTTSCSWNETTVDGVLGVKIISKVKGYENNSIFIPYAGYWQSSSNQGKGSYARLWTGTNYSSSAHQEDYATSIYVYKENGSLTATIQGYYKHFGLSVRPVYKKE